MFSFHWVSTQTRSFCYVLYNFDRYYGWYFDMLAGYG